jgi:DNA-binding HxlR family transcriptional regulator
VSERIVVVVVQEIALESEFRRTHKNLELRFLKVRFAECPVKTSLGVLGKKWALMILRDLSAYKVDRFNHLLKTLPGITPRVLATRLKELEEAGLIERVERRKSQPMIVRWALTEKGLDVFPIIMLLAAYGAKWDADAVFDDKKPRKMEELFDSDGMDLLRRYFFWANERAETKETNARLSP